jgi:hypothetical protein
MEKPKINLSTVFAFSCLVLAFAFMFYTVRMADTAALAAMRMFVLGTVGATSVNYILGSSKSSQSKDATIQQALKTNAPEAIASSVINDKTETVEL